ncbi:MAG: hypothetical protein MOIL_00446 [Candidatus Methanolliviera sp. GoM_oil]|nr:MAG: hypothetical protein MOIL_00446 [Candidatus Methanolliviera sp. GoM_oil]
MKTGVFFHEIFARNSWPVVDDRFKNFPKAMERELQLDDVDLFKEIIFHIIRILAK